MNYTTYPFRPSTAGRSIACPAWHQEAEGIPVKDSEGAGRGRRLHTITRAQIEVHLNSSDDEGCNSLLKNLADEDTLLTSRCLYKLQEILEQESISEIKSEILTERKVYGPKGLFEEGGTADVVIVVRNKETKVVEKVIIVDWKFNRQPTHTGLVFDQLSAYALCAYITWKCEAISIYAYEPENKITNFNHFFNTDMKMLQTQFEQTKRTTLERRYWETFKSGEHCQYCPAMGCPATRQVMVALEDDTNGGRELTPSRVHWILSKKRIVEDLLKAARDTAVISKQSGIDIEGVTVSERRGGRAISSILDYARITATSGVSPSQILQHTKLSHTKAVEIYANAIRLENGGTKKDAVAKANADIEECVTEAPPTFVVRVK